MAAKLLVAGKKLELPDNVCHEHQSLESECGCARPRCTEVMPALVQDGKVLFDVSLCGAELIAEGPNMVCPYEMDHVLGDNF